MTDEELERLGNRLLFQSKIDPFSDVEVYLMKRIERQEEKTKAILSILKTEWMARNNYDTFKYTPAEIEQMWTQFKRRFGL